jgi:phosphoglycerol transferase
LHFGVNWLFSTFSFLSIDELIFHLTVPFEGTGKEMVTSFIMKVFFPSLMTIILYFLFTGIYYFHGIIKIGIKINYKLKFISILPFKFVKKYIFQIIIVLFVFTLVYFMTEIGSRELYNYFFSYSTFIEDNYSDTKNVKLIFPDKKRNLIFIFMESIEVTSLSKELGGASDVNFIQEIWELTQENKNISDSEMVGGALQVSGTGWTIGAMVAQTSGLPLKLPIEGNSYTGYNSFLPGITSLGDILYENGYNQTLIVGSDAKFAGRDHYYKTHGNQKILDLFTAYKDNIIPQGYYVWWGFEDRHLYKYAELELTRLSKEQKPFSLTLLTVDTHHVGGYVCPLCKNEYPVQMSNVISCASRQVADFIDWLKHQDYYDNTTIIIQGDHLSMDSLYYEYIDYDYIRRTINVFINPALPNTYSPLDIKNRVFSTLDIFPTTLASIGVEIEGDRLGLGTNLFSDKKTILEIYGIDRVNNELGKRSKFYQRFFY